MYTNKELDMIFIISAHDLAKEQKLNFGDDITCALRHAKKKKWNMIEEKRIQQEIDLQTYINKLIREDTDRYMEYYFNGYRC